MTPPRPQLVAPFPRIAAVLALTLALAAPARAQFFQFFGNRPPPPPPDHREFRHKPTKQHARPAPVRRSPAAKAEPDKKPAAPAPVVEGPPPPYEPQLLRLSEIMGALAVLQPLCATAGATDAAAKPSSANAASSTSAAWRDSMQKLMDSQDAGPRQRERLAGAYNRGLRGYEYFHRRCTPTADLARRRLLDEGERLAHEVTALFRAE
jgi:predicted secreted protein